MVSASREEVARAAQVSVRTVSNVLSGTVRVAPSTRDRVLRAIDELDYQPSEIGRMLKTGRTGMIGLVLPGVDAPYFAELSREIIAAAAARGYTVFLDQTDGEAAREREVLARADARALFEGLIINPLALTKEDLQHAPAGRPVVLLGEEEHAGFDRVCIDNFGAAVVAVDHLFESGRRNIVAIGAEREHRSSSAIRLAGYEHAMANRGLTPKAEYVPDFHRSSGADAMTRILDRGELPDAIFCFSDLLALGALRILRERSISVPDQVAIVGFDDIEEGAFSWPNLTTIAPDKGAIAGEAVRLLVERIEGVQRGTQLVTPPYRLIVRESSAGSGASAVN